MKKKKILPFSAARYQTSLTMVREKEKQNNENIYKYSLDQYYKIQLIMNEHPVILITYYNNNSNNHNLNLNL